MKTQKTIQNVSPTHVRINAIWILLLLECLAITSLQSQAIEFCGAFPPHQATSNNPDSIYWDRFGNSYDIDHIEQGEESSDRTIQVCGFFELDFFNFGPFPSHRNTICSVFEMLSDSITQRINVSSCGDTLLPKPVRVQISRTKLDTNVLAAATPIILRVTDGSCIELFEDLVSKRINGSFTYPYTLSNYDGRMQISDDTLINWHTGTGDAPNGTYDLFSVVLHEAGHLLGFASLIDTTGFDKGFITLWDKMIHVTPEYLSPNQSDSVQALLKSDCITNCWELNDTVFSDFFELYASLINNCSVSGDKDFVFGSEAIAPLYGGVLASNNLSHLNPACNNESINYVMQRTISDSMPNNQRRMFTPSETNILCQLGYRWGECNKCFFSANSETIEYHENINYDPVFYSCVNDTISIDFDKILCNDFTNGLAPEFTHWLAPTGVSLFKTDTSFRVVTSAQGTFAINYKISGCDCQVLNALFYVNFGPCFDCTSVDPCENLTCVNGFDQFPADLSSVLVQPELSDGLYWAYENSISNSVDICLDAGMNKYINIGGFEKNLEGLCLKLSEPILPGCKIKVNLDAATDKDSAEMRIHMSKYPPCNFIDERVSIECLPTKCNDYTFTPICVDTLKISNAQTQNGTLCTPYPNLQPIQTFYWKNSTQDTLNYIIFSPTINQRSIRLDNIVVQQLCLESDFTFDYLELCNEVIFTSIDTNSSNTHLWHFGDDSTSTLMHPTHLFEKSDTFLVTHILTDYCGNADTSMLNVIINDQVTECCPDTTLSVGTTWNLTTVLPGDGRFHVITLEQGVSLSIEDGLVLEFCEGGALIIESGAYVSLDGTLTSYGDMTWQGVFVEGDTSQGQHINLGNGGFHGLQQGLIHTREGSVIKNAKIGIRNYGLDGDASTGGMIRCEETSFINNTVAVDFGPYQNYTTDGLPKSSLGTFRNCTFNTDTTYHLHEPFNAFVKMRKADGMRFAGCSFTNELLPELPSQVSEFGFGIHAVSSGFMVYAGNSTAATPICPHPCVVGDSTTIKGLGHGIYVLTQDKTQPYSVYHAQFENCFRGITSMGTTGGTILFNTFKLGHVPDYHYSYGQIGAEFHFPHEGFTLQENIFVSDEDPESIPIGVLCNDLGEFDNEIRRNTFIGVETANQAFGVNRDNNIFLPRGLRYFCNNFEETPSYGYDFHIPETPGEDLIHPFQTPGSSQGSNISAGNHFAYTAQDFMNLGEGDINYWYYSPGDNEEPRDSFSLGISDFQGNSNSCEVNYCAPSCIDDIGEIKEDFINHFDDYGVNLNNYINVIASANQPRIDSARSRALYYRRLSSRDAYTVVQHLMIDTLNYHTDSLITWMGHLDTYGAEVMIAGEYAAEGDFEGALDVLETITARRDLSAAQSVDLDKLIDIYYLMELTPLQSFTPQDRSFLRNIAYSNTGAASGISRALLSYFGEYIPLPYYHGEQINFRNPVQDSTYTFFSGTNDIPLKIYPNPTDGDVMIEWESPEFNCVSLNVLNMYGEEVFELKGDLKSPYSLNTSQCLNGMHWIIVRDNSGKNISGKFIMQRN